MNGPVLNFTSVEDLIKLAKAAKENAHCPYSKFRVGAALVTAEDKVFTGCNVENACYPVGICAERTAICKAVSEGYKQIKCIAVVTDTDSAKKPCGLCRQSLREFGKDITVYCGRNQDEVYETYKLEELLPHSFGAEDLIM